MKSLTLTYLESKLQRITEQLARQEVSDIFYIVESTRIIRALVAERMTVSLVNGGK